jgi:hypothetical protein
VWGLARRLGVDRNWLYRRIYRGRLATTRHPLTQHHLIPNDPALVARLAAEVAASRRATGRSTPGGGDDLA